MLGQETLLEHVHGHTGKCQAKCNAIEIAKSLLVILPNLSTIKHCTVWYYGDYYIRGY